MFESLQERTRGVEGRRPARDQFESKVGVEGRGPDRDQCESKALSHGGLANV
jgi:hypothetical protein